MAHRLFPSFQLLCAVQGLVLTALVFPNVSLAQSLSLPQTNAASAQTKPKLEYIPIIESAPVDAFAAFLGQTLVLEAKSTSPKLPSSEKTLQAWLVNGKSICVESKCEIPLDGKTLKPGNYSVVYIAYNSYGSVMTSHTLAIKQGGWKVGQKLDSKFKKIVPIKNNVVKAQQAQVGSATVEMLRGNGVVAGKGTLEVVGTLPRPLNWQGRMRTGRGATSHLFQEKRAEWYVMPQSDVTFLESAKSDDRNLKLTQGGLRLWLGGKLVVGENSDEVKAAKTFLNETRIETPEVFLIPEEGSDIYIRRVAPSEAGRKLRATRRGTEQLSVEEMFATKIIVISGKARISIPLQQNSQSVELPPGIEMTVYESGFVAPTTSPQGATIEELYKATFSPIALAKKPKIDEDKVKEIDLKAHLQKVEELLDREDYFEALGELSAVESRSAEDVRIKYYLGVSNRGLYQTTEAEKYFLEAAKQDDSYPLPYWQLGQMRLEEKKWEEAKQLLDEAASRMKSDDKLYPEYLYYVGVAGFQTGSGFFAKSDFTRALWETQLDSALKSSAGSFLQSIAKQRPWSIVMPLGVQYDSNALGLASNVKLPDEYNKKYTYRSIAGAIFNYDFGNGEEKPGLTHAANAKAIWVKNLIKEYSALDAFVTGVAATQTYKYEGQKKEGAARPEIEQMIFSEGVDLIFLNGVRTIESYNLSVNYKKIDFGLTFERDPINKGDANKNAVIFKQGYTFNLSGLELPVSADEKFPLKPSDSNGQTHSFTVTPGYTKAFSLRSNVKVSAALGYQYSGIKPKATNTFKVTPGVNYSYFVTPWMLGIAGVTYEVSHETSASSTVKKPGASLMLTGLF